MKEVPKIPVLSTAWQRTLQECFIDDSCNARKVPLPQELSPASLYDWYRKTLAFRRLYNEATHHLRSEKLTEEELRAFEGRIVGRIFEDISCEIVEHENSRIGDNNLRFVNGEQTFRLFLKLFPQIGRTFQLFRQDALAYINVPDFLTLENTNLPRVRSTGEITIRNSNHRVEYKIRSFQARRKQFPQLFVDYPRLNLVVPQDFEMSSVPGFVDITRVPFTRQEFREGISQPLLDYRSPSIRTAIEAKRALLTD